jgi:hypothetical protein
VKRKVRLVADGHKQVKGLNYEETFAAAAKINSIRVVLAYAAQRDWEIDQVDVVGAYLNAELNEKVYMEAPPGVLSKDEIVAKVLKLLKGLYKLKQARWLWKQKMTKVFEELGFAMLKIDHSVFFRTWRGEELIVPVSTDDMVIAGNTRTVVNSFKRELRKHFEITDLGELKWLLRFEVKHNCKVRTIAINQKTYLESMAAHFGLKDANPVYTPMEPGAVLSKDQCPRQPLNVPDHKACGHTLWPAVISWLDVQFAIGILSQFMQNPGELHWNALKRVIKYLYMTQDLWLTMGGGDGEPIGYTDLDFAGQPNRRSISGYAFLIGVSAVTWSSRKQELVALSMTEAEYIAGTHAAKELVWLRNFSGEIRYAAKGPSILHIDNRSAIALAWDNKFHAHTKHIDIKYHYIQECVEAGQLEPTRVPSKENVTDVFTKVLACPKFKYFRNLLGLRSP